MEIFQWLTQEESGSLNFNNREKVKEEIGDVLIFLANLADNLGIDPVEAAREKLKINRRKYPAELVKGKADNYMEYKDED